MDSIIATAKATVKLGQQTFCEAVFVKALKLSLKNSVDGYKLAHSQHEKMKSYAGVEQAITDELPNLMVAVHDLIKAPPINSAKSAKASTASPRPK